MGAGVLRKAKAEGCKLETLYDVSLHQLDDELSVCVFDTVNIIIWFESNHRG